MRVNADTRELKRLAVELAKAGPAVRDPVNQELREAAKEIRRKGREEVRKLTGRTARSISYTSRNKGLSYIIGPTWFVGRLLERGTAKMPAYPFMEPALRGQQDLPDRVAKAAAGSIFGAQLGGVRAARSLFG